MSSEDKDVRKKENTIIPLKIAIQKEMTYRTKFLSSLHRRPHDRDDHHSIQNFLPLKVSPSVQTPQQVAPPPPLLPPASTPSSLSGTKRKEPDNLYCEICRVSCSSVLNLKQHLMGHKHRSKLQELELNQNNSNGRHWCEVCKVACMNEDLLNLHFKGRKHRVEVHKFETCKEEGGEVTLSHRKRCELCQIWCIDMFSFKQHLQGRKHIFQLHSVQRENKNGMGGKNAKA
ncbi:UBP1-associated proteins 1C-like [Senna tora]|uniref:UBP1-associated proteins 1C-like n=1 Tax=Senna tora TaxID=362788 RepID=A0A834X665_9FABA|nr:UBP1-associated proteins 1C-like [Senna tora]